MTEKENKGLNISAGSFIVAIGILIGLMVLTYILTLVIPGGSIPFWKWALSPVLVLGSKQGGTLIAVMVFLLVIGGTFNALDRSGTMDYMLRKIVHAAGDKKYLLLAVVTLFFLSMGAFIGSFEECMKAVAKKVKGNSISDLEAFRTAVKHYEPEADVEFQMVLKRAGSEQGGTRKAEGKIYDLLDFL